MLTVENFNKNKDFLLKIIIKKVKIQYDFFERVNNDYKRINSKDFLLDYKFEIKK
jgi:hypothetical protein